VHLARVPSSTNLNAILAPGLGLIDNVEKSQLPYYILSDKPLEIHIALLSPLSANTIS
jgi:hypothetical protein